MPTAAVTSRLSTFEVDQGGTPTVLQIRNLNLLNASGFEETSTAEDGAAESYTPTLTNARLRLEMHWKANFNPKASPPNLTEGQLLSDCAVRSNVTNGPKYTGDFYVESCEVGLPRPGVVSYNCVLRANGALTFALET